MSANNLFNFSSDESNSSPAKPAAATSVPAPETDSTVFRRPQTSHSPQKYHGISLLQSSPSNGTHKRTSSSGESRDNSHSNVAQAGDGDISETGSITKSDLSEPESTCDPIRDSIQKDHQDRLDKLTKELQKSFPLLTPKAIADMLVEQELNKAGTIRALLMKSATMARDDSQDESEIETVEPQGSSGWLSKSAASAQKSKKRPIISDDDSDVQVVPNQNKSKPKPQKKKKSRNSNGNFIDDGSDEEQESEENSEEIVQNFTSDEESESQMEKSITLNDDEDDDDAESNDTDVIIEEEPADKLTTRSKRVYERKEEEVFTLEDDDDDVKVTNIVRTKPTLKTQYDGVHVISSSDDDYSDEEEESGKGHAKGTRLPGHKIQKRTAVRDECVKFLQESSPDELCAISGVSGKWAEVIISLRPYTSWNDAVNKLDSHKSSSVSSEVMSKVVDLLKSRTVVSNLMAECERISNELSSVVRQIKKARSPRSLNAKLKLKDYQLIGVNWLILMHKYKVNGILADEMGLGKTIQIIAFLAYLRDVERDQNKTFSQHLIIVPTSTMDNWIREFTLWCPRLKLLPYTGSPTERASIRDQIKKGKLDFDVAITTYNMITSQDDRKLWKRCFFEYVVFDEAHMLKNMRCLRYQALMKIDAKHRILLTGTPLQNNLLELMSLLAFCMPDMFDARLSHITSIFESYSREVHSRDTGFSAERINQAKKIMTPFILRRIKDDVLKDLPKKEEILQKVQMSDRHKELYHAVRTRLHDEWIARREEIDEDLEIADAEDPDSEDKPKKKQSKLKSGRIHMLMRLRLAANHPLLVRVNYTNEILRKIAEKLKRASPDHRDSEVALMIEDMEVMDDFELHMMCARTYPRFLAGFALDDELILDSGKFKFFDVLLPKIQKSGQKVLIFSQFVLVLNIVQDYLRIRGYKFLRLDGSTKASDRLDIIDQFNEKNSEYFIFLLTTKAGGVGINLTAASVGIIHDMDYNPYNDKQAEDRCHRMGQTKDVTIYRLMSEGTVEEGVYAIAQRKLKLSRELQDEGPESSAKDKEDLKALLRNAIGV